MAKPTTKIELIEAANKEFANLWSLINSMPEKDQTSVFLFEDRDKNLRDILVHLCEWHQMLLTWVIANQNGKVVAFLPPPYNWRTYPQMNERIWESHQNTPYKESKNMLKNSHTQVMALIETFTNDELFIKKFFPWTGTTNLGSYYISATSSHYNWAIKKIKLHIKTLKTTK